MKKNLDLALLQITDAFSIPPSAGHLIEALSSLQMTHLIFITMSSFTQTHQFVITSLSKNLPFFTGGFHINPSSQYRSLVAAVFGLFLAYLITHTCLMIGVFYQVSVKGLLNRTLSKLLAGLYLLHSRIIFFPCQFFLSSLMTFYSNSQYNEFYQSTGWFLTIIFLSVINFALVIPREFLLYQITQTKDIYSSKSNLFHQISFIYKALLLLLLVHAHNSRALIQITSIFHWLFCTILLGSLWKKLPFYDFYLFRLILILTSTNWSFALISIIQVFASSTAMKLIGSVEILILLLPIFFVKLTLLRFQDLFEKILQGKTTSPEYAIHYGVLIENSSNLHSLGFLPDKYKIAGACVAGKPSAGIYGNIVDRLEGALTQNQESEILLVSLADIYLSKLKNVPRFLQVFRRIQSMNYSRFCKKAVEDFYQKLDEVYHEDNSTISRQELHKFFADNQRIKSIYDNILKEISLHVNIWKDIENRSIDMKKTMDHALAIDQLHLNLQKQFEKNLECSQQNLIQVLLLVQIVYLNNVRNLIHETRRLIKFFHLKFPDSTDTLKIDKDLQSSPAAFIVISLDKKMPGIVLDACGPIDTIFSIKKSSLLGQNFGCLFPTTIAKIYQANLQEYAKHPTYKLDHKYKTRGKTSQGEIFELEAHFQLYCYNGKEIAVVVMLKKISEAQITFITNTEGVILDCSNGQAYKMIQGISMELEEANKAFNMLYKNLGDINKRSQGESQEDSTRNELFMDQRASYRSEETSRPLKTSGRLSFLEYSQKLDTIQPLPMKSSTEEAVRICDEFLKGKSMLLVNGKQKTKTMVQITPYVFNGEVYKVITLRNLQKNHRLFSSSSQTSLQKTSSAPEKPSPMTFADEFPGALEVKNDETKNPNYEPSTPKRFFRPNPEPHFPTRTRTLPQSDSIEHLEKRQIVDNLIQIAISSTGYQTSRKENLNREIRLSRTLQEISTSKTHTKNLKASLGVVYTSLFSIFVMSILNCVLSYNAINSVEIGLDIVYVATRKATWSITLWQDALTLYLEARSPGFISDTLRDSLQGDILTSSSQLKTASTALEGALSALNKQNLVQELYDKDIVFWNPPDDPLAYDQSNILVATDVIISKYNIFTAAYDPYQLDNSNQAPATLNNTINDYIEECRILIGKIESYLHDLTDYSITYVQVILAFDLIALVLFCVVISMVGVLGIVTYRVLFKALSNIKEESAIDHLLRLDKVRILLQEDIETVHFMENAKEILGEGSQKALNTQAKRLKAPSKSINSSTKSMTLYMIKLVLISVMFTPVLAGLFIWSVLESISSFHYFRDITDQVIVLTEAIYYSFLFVNIFNFQTAMNGIPNPKVLNQDPTIITPVLLKTAQNLNTQIASVFIGSGDPQVDQYTLDILEKDVCPVLYSTYENEICAYEAAKYGSQGLYALTPSSNLEEKALLRGPPLSAFKGLNSLYLEATQQYLNEFQQKTTFDDALEVLGRYREAVTNTTEQLQDGFPTLTEYILVNMARRVDVDLIKEYICLGCIVGFLGIYTLFLYFKALKGFRRVDLARRRILKMVPYKVIQENKAMSFYVRRTFGKESEGIKTVL